MLSSPREKLLASAAIDYFLTKDEEIIAIGTEFQFANYRRRADVVIVTSKEVLALEIKSKLDKLSNLNHQLSDYVDYFDRVFVVTEQPHVKKVTETLPENIGVLCFDEIQEKMSLPRKSKKLKRDPVKFIRDCMPLGQLRRFGIALIFSAGEEPLVIDATNHKRVSKTKAHTILIEFLLSLLTPAYAEFLKHRGEKTHSEDLTILAKRDFNSLLL